MAMFLVPKTFTSHPAAMEVKVPEVLAKDMNFLSFQIPILYPDLTWELGSDFSSFDPSS
jgi:hypothetical protein